MSEKKEFSYSYSAAEKNAAEKIRKKYEPRNAELSTLDKIKELDKSVAKAGTAASIIIGIIGAMLFGTGMSCIMVWGDKLFEIGIAVGIAGMIVSAAAYPVYLAVSNKRRKEVADEILRLTDEIL